MSNTIYTIGDVPNKTAAKSPSGKSSKPSQSGSTGGSGRWKNWKKQLNRKNASIAMLVLLVGVISYYFWSNRVPSLKASAQTLAKFEASSRFASLPLQQQQAYYDAFRASPDADRRAAMESMTSAQMQEWRANTDPFNPRARDREEFTKAFNADHSAAGKRKLLVKMMDQWQANMPTSRPAAPPNGGAGAGGAGNRPNGGRGGNAPGDMSTPFREMRQAMSEVRMENGLPSHR